MIRQPFPHEPVNRGRRSLLQMAVAGSAIGMAAALRCAHASTPVMTAASRSLLLVNTHTGESLHSCYFQDGGYNATSLRSLEHLLRDHRSGETHAIDPQLYDLLHALAHSAECEPRFEIISGYRSAATNEKLRTASDGVARRSLHMDGKAIDVRLAGTACHRLRDLAMGMQRGGVGYYAKSNFVHLDTGRVRFWSG
jgi:uncharacterized protein YcbK (DUF882 family)